jgi:hypothetical protein
MAAPSKEACGYRAYLSRARAHARAMGTVDETEDVMTTRVVPTDTGTTE